MEAAGVCGDVPASHSQTGRVWTPCLDACQLSSPAHIQYVQVTIIPTFQVREARAGGTTHTVKAAHIHLDPVPRWRCDRHTSAQAPERDGACQRAPSADRTQVSFPSSIFPEVLVRLGRLNTPLGGEHENSREQMAQGWGHPVNGWPAFRPPAPSYWHATRLPPDAKVIPLQSRGSPQCRRAADPLPHHVWSYHRTCGYPPPPITAAGAADRACQCMGASLFLFPALLSPVTQESTGAE